MREDRILDEVVFLGPDMMAGMADRPVRRDERGWVVLEGMGESDVASFVWRPRQPACLEPRNMLVISMDARAPVWGLTTWITVGSRTQDAEAVGRFKAATCGAREVQGVFRWLQPWENFQVSGASAGRWENITEIRIDVAAPRGGTLAIGPVHLARRERAKGPRLTDAEFFQKELDLDCPGMEQVREATAAGDWPAAARALFAFQAMRMTAERDLARTDSEVEICAADELMAGWIGGAKFDPDRMDWRSHEARTLNCFHRLSWQAALLAAYRQTGARRYLDRLLDWLLGWIEQNAEPEGMNDGGCDPAWTTLETACRLLHLVATYRALLPEPPVSDAARLTILKSLVAHAKHLLRWTGKDNNWIIIESRALIEVGVRLAELRGACDFRQTGLERIMREIPRQVWPDGVSTEIAPGYHWVIASCIHESLALLQSNGYAVPEAAMTVVERMADYRIYLTRPDRTCPSFNDGYSAAGSNREALEYAALKMGRQDALFVLTDGREGTPPAETSRAFPDVGIYIMRSDWSRRSNFLAFRGGRAGAAHCHEETGSFDLAAYGSPIIVETGNVRSGPGGEIDYYWSTFAGNVLTVDGAEHAQAVQPYAHRTASVRHINYWHTDGRVDIAAMRHAGPFVRGKEHIEDVVHQREIWFVKAGAEFWLLADTLWAERPHVANVLFHFMPMHVCVDRASGLIRTRCENRPNLEIRPLSALPEGSIARRFCGSHDPLHGWLALDVSVPAPCVQVDIPFAVYAVFIWLILPLRIGEAPDATVLSCDPPGAFAINVKGAAFQVAAERRQRPSPNERVGPVLSIEPWTM